VLSADYVVIVIPLSIACMGIKGFDGGVGGIDGGIN
jgi:hypothetical protein